MTELVVTIAYLAIGACVAVAAARRVLETVCGDGLGVEAFDQWMAAVCGLAIGVLWPAFLVVYFVGKGAFGDTHEHH